MAVCFTPYNVKTFSPRNKINYKYIPDIKFYCNISKDLLTDIISFMLAGYLELSVIGYNKRTEEFWAKKFIDNIYLLNFTLSIKSYECERSEMIIKCSVGNENEINNLISKITDMLKLYNSK
jgi:hypothetical protein